MTPRTPTTAAGRALLAERDKRRPVSWERERILTSIIAIEAEARASLDEHRGLTVDEWAVHLRSCSGCAARWVEARAPMDVDRLRDAARRSGMPINVTVADIENLAREYDSGVRYWDGKDAALEEPTE